MTEYRLRTFGGLALTRDGGELRDMAGQRKALVLLAILAAAGERGVPRDRLLLLLWPESDGERARGALKQMVHALRRQLGTAQAIGGIAELRLDPLVIASDVQTFRALLAAGEDEQAVALTGPFLDGVYIEGAPEFERWCDEERGALTRERLAALARLAERAERSEHHVEAARWWEARHLSDPTHAPTSARLMQALLSSGDRGGALRHAAVHAAVMRRELEAPPDASIVALEAQIRAQPEDVQDSGTSVDAVTSVPGVAARRAAVSASSSEASSPLGALQRPHGAIRAPRAVPAPRRTVRWMGAAVIAVAGVAILVYRGRDTAREQRTEDAARALASNRVAVSIFVNRTGSPELDALGTMTSDWVARGVARTPGVEVFDVGGLYLSGRAPDGSPTDPRTLARANGAGLVVAGNYYRLDTQLTFSAQVLDVATGRVLRTLDPVSAPVAEPLAAVEELRQRVASALGSIVDPRTSQWMTATLAPPRYDAYSEFAAGQEIYWRGDWEAALPHFRRAAALDTGFHTALAFVGVAGVGTARCALADSVLEVLQRRGVQVPALDRLTAQVSVARCASDHDTHNRLQRERAALVPGSRNVQLILSTGFRQLNRPAEALAVLSQLDPARDLGWLPARGRSFYWREVGATQHLLRDFEGERATAARMRGGDASPLAVALLEGRALAAMGQSDSARAAVQHVASSVGDPALLSGISGQLAPVQLATAGWVMWTVALELAAHGDASAGRRTMEDAVRWYSSEEGRARASTASRIILARALDFLDRADEALAELDRLPARERESIDARGTRAVIEARRGNRAVAMDTDAWLDALPRQFPPGLPTLYRAQIAAASGDSARALSLLRALPHGAHPLDVLHFHVDPAFATLRRTSTLERWLVPRG